MRILLPVPSFLVTLVEKLPESVFRLVTRVENEALSDCKLFISLAKLALATEKAPLIFEAICAEPLINVLDNSDSAVVNLSEILALGAVKDPDISSAN